MGNDINRELHMRTLNINTLGKITFAISMAMAATDHACSAPSIQTEYGFTAHIGDRSTNTQERISAHRRMIDELAKNDVKWLRIGVDIAITKYNSPTSITFNEEDWTPAVEIYNYALAKGMKVFFTAYPAYELRKLNLSESDFLKSVNFQFSRLATKFPKAEVWQIYNEANHAYKDDYSPVCNHTDFTCKNGQAVSVSDSYMNSLRNTISTAKNAIRSINPTAKITTNAAGGDAYAQLYMSKLEGTLDIFSFDIYPDEYDHQQNFTSFKSTLRTLNNKYGNNFWLVETGKPSSTGACNTESTAHTAEHKKFLVDLVPAIAEEKVTHALFYEFRDRDTSWIADCEKHFGIIDRHDLQKPAYKSLLEQMKLFAYMPINSDSAKNSQALSRLNQAFQTSFGRPPSTWEAYNTNYDGWLRTVASNNNSYDDIVNTNKYWLFSPEGAN